MYIAYVCVRYIHGNVYNNLNVLILMQNGNWARLVHMFSSGSPTPNCTHTYIKLALLCMYTCIKIKLLCIYTYNCCVYIHTN